MPSLNKVFLAGNLTRDPELRYTPGGTAVAQFSVAINRRYRDGSGQMQEEATFVDIETWGRQAESSSEYLSKGSPVLIEGRLKLDQWQSKATGERRSKLRVVGERVQFIGPRRGGGRPAQPRPPKDVVEPKPEARGPEPPAGGAPSGAVPDNEIPF